MVLNNKHSQKLNFWAFEPMVFLTLIADYSKNPWCGINRPCKTIQQKNNTTNHFQNHQSKKIPFRLNCPIPNNPKKKPTCNPQTNIKFDNQNFQKGQKERGKKNKPNLINKLLRLKQRISERASPRARTPGQRIFLGPRSGKPERSGAIEGQRPPVALMLLKEDSRRHSLFLNKRILDLLLARRSHSSPSITGASGQRTRSSGRRIGQSLRGLALPLLPHRLGGEAAAQVSHCCCSCMWQRLPL